MRRYVYSCRRTLRSQQHPLPMFADFWYQECVGDCRVVRRVRFRGGGGGGNSLRRDMKTPRGREQVAGVPGYGGSSFSWVIFGPARLEAIRQRGGTMKGAGIGRCGNCGINTVYCAKLGCRLHCHHSKPFFAHLRAHTPRPVRASHHTLVWSTPLPRVDGPATWWPLPTRDLVATPLPRFGSA